MLLKDVHILSEKIHDAVKTLYAPTYFLPAFYLQSDGILVIPTSPSAPPKLQTKVSVLAGFRDKAFTLLSIAGMSGACQVTEVLLYLINLK